MNVYWNVTVSSCIHLLKFTVAIDLHCKCIYASCFPLNVIWVTFKWRRSFDICYDKTYKWNVRFDLYVILSIWLMTWREIYRFVVCESNLTAWKKEDKSVAYLHMTIWPWTLEVKTVSEINQSFEHMFRIHHTISITKK